MSEAAAMVCPKCGSDMRSYERNGVVVDQCTGCRGIFLDRGELERLVDAEGRHWSGSREDQPREHKKKSKKRSFLENLFEGE
ncbi:MAG TPA: zf-TFIIB domain-containing protein [Solirubrobacterales bacterium]|nr:zf-TFIIB domain-containing protein [Solirubrobacterales bacterium]